MVAKNSADFLVHAFALLRAGATPAFVNWRLSVRELTEVLTLVEPKAVAADAEFAPLVDAGLADAGRSALRVTIGGGSAPGALDGATLAGPVPSRPALTGDTVLALVHTSGTTGRAKAIPLRSELAARQSRYDEALARVTALDVAAATAGRWLPDAPTELTGRAVKRGELLGYLVAGPTDRVRVAVTQEDADLVRHRVQAVQVRLMQWPYGTLDAHVRLVRRGVEALAAGTGEGCEVLEVLAFALEDWDR